MARSTLTVKELRAQAMLLGMTYDAHDHTFCGLGDNDTILDADTMELMGIGISVVQLGRTQGASEGWGHRSSRL